MATEHLDACPTCQGEWSTVTADGRKLWPMLAGSINNDRVTAWCCLHCHTTWDRHDPTITQEVAS